MKIRPGGSSSLYQTPPEYPQPARAPGPRHGPPVRWQETHVSWGELASLALLRMDAVRIPLLLALIAALALAGGLSACQTTTTQVPAWGFGLALGAVLDKTTALPMDALIAGRALYRVRPPKPHREMSDYAVIADRESGRMIGIVGWDRYSSDAVCKTERTALERAMERRYGPGRPSEPSDRERMHGLPESLNTSDMTVFTGWQGIVALGCAGPRLLVVYWYVKPEPDANPERTR